MRFGKYKNIASASTTVISRKSCYLHHILINKNSAGTITFYDNSSASGDKIATLKANIVEGYLPFFCVCKTGLTVVTAGSSDITVVFS